MSGAGGRLVVLDRGGRAVKSYSLPEGNAILGNDEGAHVRLLMAGVDPHHATVIIHANQAVIRSVSTGETFVNGQPISVAALRHNDIISVGGRNIRWEYFNSSKGSHAPEPTLVCKRRGASASKLRRRTVPAKQLVLTNTHTNRASMPASTSIKQVAIVQPQRRDTVTTNEEESGANRSQQVSSPRRSGAPAHVNQDVNISHSAQPTTKAAQWMESRARARGSQRRAPRDLPAKIQPPLAIDQTKRAAIMLMTRHTKSTSPDMRHGPTLLVKRPSPVKKQSPQKRATPKKTPKKMARKTPSKTPKKTPKTTNVRNTPKRISINTSQLSVGATEVTDVPEVEISEGRLSVRRSNPRRSGNLNVLKSPKLASPKKSALKDPSKRLVRKTESIKFDLSNLDQTDRHDETNETLSDDDLILRYSDSSDSSQIITMQSRGSRILEKSLGSPMSILSRSSEKEEKRQLHDVKSPTAKSPRFSRSSIIVDRALKRSSRNLTSSQLESYSIVDLVSVNSTSSPSVYDSVPSSPYGTPNNANRTSRSFHTLTSSTPYRANITLVDQSMTTPENSELPQPERVSRLSRTRSRLNESELMDDDDSPKSSRRCQSAPSPERTISSPQSRISPRSASQILYLSAKKPKNISRNTLRTTGHDSPSTSKLNTSKTVGLSLSRPSQSPRSPIRKNLSRSTNLTATNLDNTNSLTRDNESSGRRSRRESPNKTNKILSETTGLSLSISSHSPRSPSRKNISEVISLTASTLDNTGSMISDTESSAIRSRRRTPKKAYESLSKTGGLSPRSPIKQKLSRSMNSTITNLDNTDSLVLNCESLLISSRRLSPRNANDSLSKTVGLRSSQSPRSPNRKTLSGSMNLTATNLENTNSLITDGNNSAIRSRRESPNKTNRILPEAIGLSSSISRQSPRSPSKKKISEVINLTASTLDNTASLSGYETSAIRSTRGSPTKANESLSKTVCLSLSRSSQSPRSPMRKKASGSMNLTATNLDKTDSMISENESSLTRSKRGISKKANESLSVLVTGSSNRKSISRSNKRKTRGTVDRESLKKFNHKSSITNEILKGPDDIDDGTTTPDQQPNNEEVTTPVLSIQSLLDQSHSFTPTQSFSFQKIKRSSKRKTLGSIGRSKRVKSDTLQNSGDVTPTSAVKLQVPGVKNKHSTAKKTTSKRTLIDDLNESDLVKQLFNSPVKRNLSRSMVEFTARENDQPRKRTRATIAMHETPDHSVSFQDEAFTPELFVSPLSTPRHSPNLEGVQRLLSGNENEYAKASSSRTSLRNTNKKENVYNIKGLFAKSPNRLSDVRVKKLFAKSPHNDLRKVTGVKSLFLRNTRKSPRNNLEDVRGVKRLFGRSPRDDLRNVSGVKKVFRRGPKNNLSDVRGVKRLSQKIGRISPELSGVELLFQETDMNSTFDQLMDRPAIRAYPASARKPVVKKNKVRETKSLHDSIDSITNNVEEWLDSELKRRLNKPSIETNKTRELQKLSTNTVEGQTPLILSRTRNNTATYSDSTLPIKKRSLVNKSNKSDESRALLPLKKRLVVHSTPMKGRYETMNASELGRVSPIAVQEKTVVDNIARNLQDKEASTYVLNKNGKDQSTGTQTSIIDKFPSPKRKSVVRGRKSAATQYSPKEITENNSPKKVSNLKTSPNTTSTVKPKPRITRNTKRLKASIAILKKSPVFPKSTTRRKKTEISKLISPNETSDPKPKRGHKSSIKDIEQAVPNEPIRMNRKQPSKVISQPTTSDDTAERKSKRGRGGPTKDIEQVKATEAIRINLKQPSKEISQSTTHDDTEELKPKRGRKGQSKDKDQSATNEPVRNKRKQPAKEISQSTTSVHTAEVKSKRGRRGPNKDEEQAETNKPIQNNRKQSSKEQSHPTATNTSEIKAKKGRKGQNKEIEQTETNETIETDRKQPSKEKSQPITSDDTTELQPKRGRKAPNKDTKEAEMDKPIRTTRRQLNKEIHEPTANDDTAALKPKQGRRGPTKVIEQAEINEPIRVNRKQPSKELLQPTASDDTTELKPKKGRKGLPKDINQAEATITTRKQLSKEMSQPTADDATAELKPKRGRNAPTKDIQQPEPQTKSTRNNRRLQNIVQVPEPNSADETLPTEKSIIEAKPKRGKLIGIAEDPKRGDKLKETEEAVPKNTKKRGDTAKSTPSPKVKRLRANENTTVVVARMNKKQLAEIADAKLGQKADTKAEQTGISRTRKQNENTVAIKVTTAGSRKRKPDTVPELDDNNLRGNKKLRTTNTPPASPQTKTRATRAATALTNTTAATTARGTSGTRQAKATRGTQQITVQETQLKGRTRRR
ncbi:uncharacterized protein LOC126977164 isoform X2 [Leptidea sinapis]|uniref:uncharacterized protein LOC126977164 isoform X2 n=1 Tax=Leptidea sinapis TaxID=189913 RepID=UPI0021225AA2|nr:uncharacterized protein LOC126977164 isoform X2 [Leptidea sinapis]